MSETVFQKIISGDILAAVVYESDTTFAFLDHNPTHKGHTLVIPKKPVVDIFTLTDPEAGDLMRTIVRVANAVQKATGAPGVNIISNNGVEAGQEVLHLHFHVVPRFDKEEFRPLPRTTYANDEEQFEFAKKISEALQ